MARLPEGIETFKMRHNYEYAIFSILSSARAWANVILAGKRDSRRHSTTSFSGNVVVAETLKLSCYLEIL